jgi:transcription elongation factor S-II
MASVRDTVRAKLCRLLDADAVLAHNLEIAIFNKVVEDAQMRAIPLYWNCPAFARCYKAKAGSMLYNLRPTEANKTLRSNVLDGTVSVEELVAMTPQELCPARWVEVLYDVARMQHARMAPQPGLDAAPGVFACRRCKSMRTTYFQLQTRSADEPMTTFVSCLDCDKRWKM